MPIGFLDILKEEVESARDLRPISYRTLKEALENLPEEELDCSITLFDPSQEEFYGVASLMKNNQDDTEVENDTPLDLNTPLLVMNK